MRYTISLTLASLLGTSAALAEVPRVVADIPPVHALVAQVMGDLGTPELLLDQGANAHSFQLRPSQAAGLVDAALIVWIGPDMTPWLDRALSGLEAKGAQLHLLEATGTHTQEFGATGGHDHAEADGHEDHGHAQADGHEDHGHAEAEGHDDHDHGGADPHAWLDPANAAVWLGAIAAELGRLDPANAATYSANATAGQAGLAQLDAELAAMLAPIRDRPFVVFHDAYGYFTAHYGLTVAGTVALGDAASPGAARLAGLRDELQAGAALCIFPEAQHDPKLVEQMAMAGGVKLGGALDPEGSQLTPGAGLYGNLMRGLAGTLTACLADG